MSFDQIKVEASNLPVEQRKALISYLLTLGREERDASFRRMLAQKVDDNDPAHWVTFEELPSHLKLGPEAE